MTPEQKARLDAMPAATRDMVLTWLMLGDPILVAEANKLLTPPRPRPAAPRTLPEVLSRIREDPSFPALAADWLSSVFEDRKSYAGFKARCEEAWRGELPVARLVSAYEQASGPKAKNRGALFMHALRGGDGQPGGPAIGPARSPFSASSVVRFPTASMPLRLRE